MENAKTGRKVYLDLLKVLAILMVLYQHRNTYILAMQYYTPSVKTAVMQALAFLCRCGVPLFFMASGAVLLGKKESFGKILRHRVLRILIVMAICAAIFIFSWGSGSSLTLPDVLLTRLNWYLYAYIGYLLMLPFLRLIAMHADAAERKAYLALVAVFYTLTTLLVCVNHTSFVEFMPLLTTVFASGCWSVIFTLTGYFLADDARVPLVQNKARALALLGVGAAVSVAAAVVFTARDIPAGGANVDTIRLHLLYLPSCFVFCLCRLLCEKVPLLQREGVKKAIVTVSGTTFGIFILETHSALIDIINRQLYPLEGVIGQYRTALLSVLIQFTLCFLITLVLKQIPYLKKIL